ncbi:MAG: cytochrome c oxidase assembly protein [Pseudomonadota bacterium]
MSEDTTTQQNARKTARSALMLVAGMGALSFASVPLYDLFCRVTGWGGTTQVADEATGEVLDQTILVRFDASTGRDMPWVFEPVQREMRVRIGETGLAFYRATNPSDRPVMGTASFNVAPFEVGSYFTKIQCFCFVEQVLQPGESMEMPVTFFVDPEIVDDPERSETKVITLSYTFYETEDQQAGVGKALTADAF